jgi:hypothetical protein
MMPPNKVGNLKKEKSSTTVSADGISPAKTNSSTGVKQRTSNSAVKNVKIRSVEDLCNEYDAMKHELKTIKNTYKKTEAGVDRVMEMGEDVTDLRLLVSQLSSR